MNKLFTVLQGPIILLFPGRNKKHSHYSSVWLWGRLSVWSVFSFNTNTGHHCLSLCDYNQLGLEVWENMGLPSWRSSWESACQCRGHRFEPWSGKIPHATEQLGPWATTTEPARLEPVLRNKRGCNSERPAHRDEERPPLAATRESSRTETKTQHSQK